MQALRLAEESYQSLKQAEEELRREVRIAEEAGNYPEAEKLEELADRLLSDLSSLVYNVYRIRHAIS